MGSKAEYLFVYGTLMQSIHHPMSELLRLHANLLGKGKIRGQLYDLGNYPGLILTRDGKQQVFGEIYEFCDKVRLLRQLDEYEGCSEKDPKPHLYEREMVSVKLTSEQNIMAWTYIYKGNLVSKPRIECGDYAAYMHKPSRYFRFTKAL